MAEFIRSIMRVSQKAAWARGQLPRGTKPGWPFLASFSAVTVALTQRLPSWTLIQALTLTDTRNPRPGSGWTP